MFGARRGLKIANGNRRLPALAVCVSLLIYLADASPVSPSGDMATPRSPPQVGGQCGLSAPRRSIRAEISGLEGNPVSSTSSSGYALPGWLDTDVLTKSPNDGSWDFKKSRRFELAPPGR